MGAEVGALTRGRLTVGIGVGVGIVVGPNTL